LYTCGKQGRAWGLALKREGDEPGSHTALAWGSSQYVAMYLDMEAVSR